jgi:hypothetical protein
MHAMQATPPCTHAMQSACTRLRAHLLRDRLALLLLRRPLLPGLASGPREPLLSAIPPGDRVRLRLRPRRSPRDRLRLRLRLRLRRGLVLRPRLLLRAGLGLRPAPLPASSPRLSGARPVRATASPDAARCAGSLGPAGRPSRSDVGRFGLRYARRGAVCGSGSGTPARRRPAVGARGRACALRGAPDPRFCAPGISSSFICDAGALPRKARWGGSLSNGPRSSRASRVALHVQTRV